MISSLQSAGLRLRRKSSSPRFTGHLFDDCPICGQWSVPYPQGVVGPVRRLGSSCVKIKEERVNFIINQRL